MENIFRGDFTMNTPVTLTTCDGYKLSAVHTIAKKHKIVLWLHGITTDKNEYLDFFKDGVEFLANQGIDSLRIDFRGHGKSSGTSKDFSVIGQVIDAKTAIKYIKNFYDNDIEIFLLGCSFGAPPAIFLAEEYHDMKKIFLISPVLSYKRTFLVPETEWARELFNPETLSQLEKNNELFLDENFKISLRLVEEMKIIKPEMNIKQTNKQIFIIHGETDSMVPFSVSENISRECNNVSLIPIKGMDHGFMDEMDEDGTGEKSQNNKRYIYEFIVENCS